MNRLTRLCLILIVALNTTVFAQENCYFGNWPAGLSPQEGGKQVSEHFVTSPHQYGPTIHYSEVATWYGALTFASLTHDDTLRTELIHKFEPLTPGGAEAARIPVRHHGLHLWRGPAGDCDSNQGSQISRHGKGLGRPSMGESPAGRLVGRD